MRTQDQLANLCFNVVFGNYAVSNGPGEVVGPVGLGAKAAWRDSTTTRDFRIVFVVQLPSVEVQAYGVDMDAGLKPSP